MKNLINVKHIKNYFSQKIVLILGLVLLIPIITSLVASIISVSLTTGFLEDISSIIRATGGSNEDVTAFNIAKNFGFAEGIGMALFQFIISALVPTAWLFIYFRSKSPDINKTPSGGLMFFYVIYIIGIVSASIILLLGIASSILGIIAMAATNDLTGIDYGATFFVSVLLIISGAVFILYGTFTLIFSIFGMKFFGGARKSMTSPNMIVTGKGYGVMLAIYSVFAILSGLTIIIAGCVIPSVIKEIFISNLSNETAMSGMESVIINSLFDSIVPTIILSGVATVVSAISYILESKIAIGYCRMAKSVPPTPNQYIPYNSYNQNNPYNQNSPYNQNNQYNPYNQVPPQG